MINDQTHLCVYKCLHGRSSEKEKVLIVRQCLKVHLPIRYKNISHLVCFILLFTDHAKTCEILLHLLYNFVSVSRIGKRVFKRAFKALLLIRG